MRLYRCVLVAAALVLADVSSAHSLDMAKVTCRAFIASGHDNMAAMIMWLRGYHSGKLGVITAIDTAEMRRYGGRLGRYCKEHPDASVIDASEQILSNEDHSI
jgi:hypothetical protein